MKKALVLTLYILATISCATDVNTKSEPQHFITKDAAFVIKIRNLGSLSDDLKNNDFINLDLDDNSNPIKSGIQILQYLETDNDIILAGSKTGLDDESSFQLITKFHDSLIKQDSINLDIIDLLDYNQNIITKRRIDTDTFYSAVVDSFLLGSNTKNELERLLDTQTSTSAYNSLIDINSNSNLSLYAITKHLDSVAKPSNTRETKTVLDMDLMEDLIEFAGITLVNDSIPGAINYLSGTKAMENRLVSIVPGTSRTFESYTFSDLGSVLANYSALNLAMPSNEIDDIKDLVLEIGKFDIQDREAKILRSLDTQAIITTINGSLLESFRQIDIYSIDPGSNLTSIFLPFFDTSASTHFFIIDDFLVFTTSLEDAQFVITNFTNKSTLENTEVYKNLKEKISDEASILKFSLSSELDSLITIDLPNELSSGLLSKNLEKDHAQLLQIITDNDFAHVHFLLQESKNRARTNTISEVFNITLDNTLLNDPQIVKNHVTGQKDIIVQDIDNYLYMISNRGRVLWKKKLSGPILGTIEQIDIYKNGRLQLIFATPHELHVIDRNGKSVRPFPMKFNDEITQPLSVFDYDQKKDYRLMVVQGSNVLMYNVKGKTVRGFNFKKANTTIDTQPKHFRVGNKDYIVFSAGNKMYILNRRGQTRINVNENIDFSENEIYIYKNNFTTTSTKGELIQVNQKGQVAKQDLMLSAEHDVTATSKTLVSLVDNDLTIRTNSVELDFGDYTAPKIFYLKDKIYVSLTDLQTQRVYLFDSQAKSIANFPVYGNSSIELTNIDKNKNLEFVVKGNSNSVILYRIN